MYIHNISKTDKQVNILAWKHVW